ncbi:MAG TPA: MEKHLA domain-containing protein [Nitrospiraceae bacterium]|nr:MEKHLA domain-containing protein [Nitrospiraceae bacterium]
MRTSPIWSSESVVMWSQVLLASYRHWLGTDLIEPVSDPVSRSRVLFHAPFVVVSHGVEEDPLLNYGNQMALSLWELSWDELMRTPSRLTAEPVNRAEREGMLEQARTNGHIKNYRGVRISKSGRRFLIEQAVVWNVVDSNGRRLGQAATFSTWSFL